MKSVFIIAEMGVNHNGNMEIARQLIDAAITAGADAVKTQSFYATAIASINAEKAVYQKATAKEISQLEMLKKLELSPDCFCALTKYAKDKGILLLSTPFELQSIKELYQLQIPIFKIPSGEITNLPYLIEIGKTRKPVILSTGMATISEIAEAIDVLRKHGTKDISLLHCNTQYPTPFEDANLLAIQTLKKEFGLPVGFSDHTLGIEASIAAVALGAQIIEKHFTLSTDMEGPDHRASIEPEELKALVAAIRNIEKAMGDGIKCIMPSERDNMAVVRKSIVAARDIQEGEVFSEENITTKRPGNGISPMRWFEVMGRKTNRTYEKDELIEISFGGK